MKVRCSFWVCCAAALVVPALAPGGARGDQLAGVVTAVDVQARKVVVAEQKTDDKVDLAVAPDAAIMTVNGRPMTIKDIKKGDGIGISHVGGVAVRIVVNQGPLLGVVEKIDLDGRSFVVSAKGTGRDVTVTLAPETTIETPDGKVYALKDLKSGDGVSVTYNGADVAKVAVNAKPDELGGHVKTVAADLKSFVITELGSQKDVRVEVTPKTAIVTNEGKTMELKDLKKGDGVGIAHDASVASKIVVNPAPAP
ncbi:MAG: hypothetical protein P4L84_02660 [Isosphaeraceae bacterium]|nr:hypothetical protein [Isosphaeraceae bacterium]